MKEIITQREDAVFEIDGYKKVKRRYNWGPGVSRACSKEVGLGGPMAKSGTFVAKNGGRYLEKSEKREYRSRRWSGEIKGVIPISSVALGNQFLERVILYD